MHTNEHPSGKPSGRTITIHLTYDSLMLISALFFLIIAISLVFLFPSASTTEPVAIKPTAAAAPATQAPSPAPPIAPSVAPPVPVAQAAAYPAPQAASAHTDAVAAVAAASAVSPPYPAPPAADGTGAPGADPAAQPTEVPSFMAVSPDTVRSPTLLATGPTQASLPAQASVPAATDAKLKPQAASKPAAAAADGSSPPPAQAVPKPKPQPMTVVRESQLWDKTKYLDKTYKVAGNATLTIGPGVEVQFAPGASLIVEGTLSVEGAPEQPVRFVGAGGASWESIIGTRGSNISLKHTEIHNGGGGGTLISTDSGNLLIHDSKISGNGGHLVAKNSRVIIQNTLIAENEMPYGAALEVSYSGPGSGFDTLVLHQNRILHNGLSEGTVPLQITNDRPLNSSISLDIDRNLLIGQAGPDVTLIANGILQGNITCNALVGGANGLSVHSNQTQAFYTMLNIRDNAIEQHTPPLDPFYRQNHIGRGASSEIPLKMDANWWGNPLGPYAADRHADGRGDAVGANISFDAWHTTRPECAPIP